MGFIKKLIRHNDSHLKLHPGMVFAPLPSNTMAGLNLIVGTKFFLKFVWG